MIFSLEFVNIRAQLKDRFKSLLPRKVNEGVSLNRKSSKIKPRVSFFAQVRLKKVLRLKKLVSRVTFLILVILFLLGYYPTFSYPPIRQSVVRAQQEQSGEVIAASFPSPVILPHPGYLSTKFSNWHPGIDIAADLSTLIHPITSGKVLEVGTSFWGLGNFVVISHDNGFESKYAHMGRVFVKKDQIVSSEDILGEVGMSGNTSGPHTHLEITLNGKYINPQTILPEIPVMPR